MTTDNYRYPGSFGDYHRRFYEMHLDGPLVPDSRQRLEHEAVHFARCESRWTILSLPAGESTNQASLGWFLDLIGLSCPLLDC